MKKLIPILLTVVLISCSKEVTKESCAMCYLLSEKYTYDSVYIRTDPLFEGLACGDELDKFKAAHDTTFKVCNPNIIEHWKYIIKTNL